MNCFSPSFASPDGCQALGVHGVKHVVGRDAVRPDRILVEIDHNLPVLAAIGCRQRDAGDRRQGLAHLVDAVVIKLLLNEPLGTEAELQHRHRRGLARVMFRQLNCSGQNVC
jgi:hypothetical protein